MKRDPSFALSYRILRQIAKVLRNRKRRTFGSSAFFVGGVVSAAREKERGGEHADGEKEQRAQQQVKRARAERLAEEAAGEVPHDARDPFHARAGCPGRA